MAEELSRLEALKKKMYMIKDASKLPFRKEGVLHPVKMNISRAWDTTKTTSMKTSKVLNKKNKTIERVFLFALLFFIVAIGYSLWSFSKGGNVVSNDNIDLAVIGNAFTPGGEPLTLQVSVTNRNHSDLELADVILEYPKDRSTSTEVVRVRKQVGTISSGATVNTPFDLTLYGEQGSIKDIKATLEYHIPNSNALFVKDSTYAVTLSTAPLLIAVDGPDVISPNQPLSFSIKATSNTSVLAQNMIVKIEYPTGFSMKSSSVAPSVGNNVFDLGDLTQGVEKNIQISGTLSGEESDERTFRIYAGEQNESAMDQIAVMYNSTLYSVKVSRPLFDVHFEANNSFSGNVYTAAGGSTIVGSIVWSNTSSSRILNAQIEATVSGDAIDSSKIKAEDGLYNEATGTFYWNRDTARELAIIEPNSSGRFNFSFGTRSTGPNGEILSNPEIIVEVRTAALSDGGGTNDSISSIDRKIVRLGSDLGLSSELRHSTGAFTDEGMHPPKTGSKTTYTVVWTVSNSTNPVTGAIARAVLPSSVEFVGTVSPKNEQVDYNQLTKEVKWTIGSVKKSGGGGLTRQVSFQVAVMPTPNQVGQEMGLVGNTTLSATDTFTGDSIRVGANGLSTSSIAGTEGKVVR